MLRENVLEYFRNGKEENFQWFRGPYLSRKLCDFNLHFRTENLGNLQLSTGKIIASDPLTFFDEKPFSIQMEKGNYDVILSIAKIVENYDGTKFNYEKVAFAMLKFNENRPVRWKLALREKDDISNLTEGKIFGYGVDSGTGCFMDVETQKILNELYFDEELDFHNIFCREMDKNHSVWLNYDFEGLPKNNVIAFSSGWGDGCYASYFGFDENNQTACLITDFNVVKDSEN